MSPFSLRVLCVRLYDLFYRETRMLLRQYTFSFQFSSRNRNVFMADGSINHGGMFDRLKGMVSVYAVSKAQKKDFRIHFTSPFALEQYLQPNHYAWLLPATELQRIFPATRPLILYGECVRPFRLLKKRKRESHFYYGYDSLEDINAHYGTSFDWGTLYRELFRPTPFLQAAIEQSREAIGRPYIAIHLRCMNLLGDTTEKYGNCPTLPLPQQAVLKNSCKEQLQAIGRKHPDHRIVVASDSNRFIAYIQTEMPEIYCIPGEAKHVDTAETTGSQADLKLFLDYYILSEADHVYSIVGQGLYSSAFPRYSALIGSKPFERITLSNASPDSSSC